MIFGKSATVNLKFSELILLQINKNLSTKRFYMFNVNFKLLINNKYIAVVRQIFFVLNSLRKIIGHSTFLWVRHLGRVR